MKNVIFIPNINLGDGRNNPYHYSVKSWKQWCNKNNCELLVLDELLYPVDYMKITWQRYYLFDILDANEVEYDQVLMVDADTIVHPECPNFFDMSEGKLCGAQFDGSWDWVLRSLENYSKYVFENEMITWYEYIDCGFVLMNKNHKDFCKKKNMSFLSVNIFFVVVMKKKNSSFLLT